MSPRRPGDRSGKVGKEASVDRVLAAYLMQAINADAQAASQPDGQYLAAILVCENAGCGIINLRMHDHTEPTAALWRVFNKMRPLLPYHKERSDNPHIGRVYNWARQRGLAL